MIEHRTEQPTPRKEQTSHWLWLGPLLYMVVVGLYLVGRYAGQWAESDSAAFTNLIRDFAREGRLVPVQGEVYPNGYAYQAISTFIIALTGLDAATLQQLIYPLVASLVVLPAWVLYRELTGSASGATLTTILLFTQPEFLFVILRSSHEKFTRALMLLCLFLLIRSLKLSNRPKLLYTYMALFYLAAFAFIASNNLLAHSFILAIATSLAIGWLLAKRNAALARQSGYILRRLLFVTLICLGMVYIFTFYLYPPAQHDLLVLQSLWDRVAALLLNFQAQATNPYAQISAAWAQPVAPVYFIVSAADWIILVASLVIWIWQGVQWLWRGKTPPLVDWLLWLFYAAFAVQGALSAVADMTGVLSANLQHRLFPSFSIIAVALVGVALARWHPGRFARPIQLGLSVGIFCIAVLSVSKAINEPVLSNKWTFYHSDELAALDWSDRHLKSAEIWTEFDERLAVAFLTQKGNLINNNLFVYGPLQSSTRDIILTMITRLRSGRLYLPLPVPTDALQVYDNGESVMYHLRPQTPYQR